MLEREVEPIEVEERLSRSLLWRLQRAYFHRAGVEAWSRGEVPHYVTNNPALARAYAHVFFGFFRDTRAASRDLDEPLTIVELGAGSGRFAFLFLSAFSDLLARSPLAGARFRYVMTDFTENNLEFWRSHPRLQPFVEQGALDFAVFDVESDREIRLHVSGETIAPGGPDRPLGVIANYVFDGVPMDAFSFDGGALQECLVTLGPMRHGDNPPVAPGDVDATFTRRPAALDYYGEPALDSILRGYASSLSGATVLFPCSALRCIGRLADLGRGGLLLVSGDRGGMRPEARTVGGDVEMATHGSFSMKVNFHALAEYVRGLSGLVLAPAHPDPHLTVAAFVVGAPPTGWGETRLAFEERLGQSGPGDFFLLRRAIQGGYERLDLATLLAAIRLGGWDPRILYDCCGALKNHRAGATDEEAREVVRAVMLVWERYYSIGEPDDLAFAFGLVAYAYGGFREALSLFQASLDLRGPDPKTWWNIALCHTALGAIEPVEACLREIARLAPGFAPPGPAEK